MAAGGQVRATGVGGLEPKGDWPDEGRMVYVMNHPPSCGLAMQPDHTPDPRDQREERGIRTVSLPTPVPSVPARPSWGGTCLRSHPRGIWGFLLAVGSNPYYPV